MKPPFKFFEAVNLNISLSPSHLLFSSLQKCSFRDLKPLHATMIKNNSHQDSLAMNQFVTACGRLHQIDHAFAAFSRMEDPNIFVYNSMMRSFIQCSAPFRALQLFIKMPKSEDRPTCHTFSHLIKACVQIQAVRFGEAVHGQIWKMGFCSDLVLQTGLVDFYSVMQRINCSRKVFDEMSIRDTFSWNTMIFGYAHCGDLAAARNLFDEMPEKNCVSWNTMVSGYARMGDVESAAFLFDLMPCKNLISWTSIISCYSRNKLFKEALEAFDAMKVAGMSPDNITMATVISACAHLGALQEGKRLHYEAVLNKFIIDSLIGSALIDLYAKCGCIARSLVTFFNLEEKNLFCWNSIIDGLAMNGQAKDAIFIFSKMIGQRIKPNNVTFVSILSACAHGGLVEEGRRMFMSMIEDHSINPEIEHYSCMVDLLARSGLLDDALGLIQKVDIEPKSVMWRALLSGCKIHGNIDVGKIAMERLRALDPFKSSSYMLLVDMYAKENRWAEVSELRGKVKEMRAQKKRPGCSWIEMEGLIIEFAACDSSHPLSEILFLLLNDLYCHMKLAGFQPNISC
ncbi:Pentatricopeptide repeat-containing protein [Apostasia shenzhenica]|uniref:Pentatricopeptide repeat-containing protein n=1 Tax=Apostasia shenzhenica TaxID=1088818 RepID=A0A2I0A908_9ASPA|nr:Pentatricopeptide repeat-containing protein [Apostasia shenzhenica]